MRKGIRYKLGDKIFLEPAWQVYTEENGIKQIAKYFNRFQDAIDYKDKLNKSGNNFRVGTERK